MHRDRIKPKTFTLTPLRGFVPTFQTFGVRNLQQVLTKFEHDNVGPETILGSLLPAKEGATPPVEFRSDGMRISLSYFTAKGPGIERMAKSKGSWRKVMRSGERGVSDF